MLCAVLGFLHGIPAGALAQSLTRITGVHPTLATGSSRAINWVDADNDNDLDLYVTNGGRLFEKNEYYRNDAGVFARDTTIAITRDSLRDDGSTWGDYDNDGDEDLFLASWYGEVNALYRNLGAGSFQRITGIPVVTTSTYSEGSAWADYDQDGDLDLYIANSGAGAFRDNLLYRNDGGGTFTAITSGSPIVDDNTLSRGPSWGDYDNDGDLDLFVATETGFPNKLYKNMLDETGIADFADVSAGDLTSGDGNSWSGSWGDFDNDGDFDIVVANNGGENDFLYRNELAETGTATFTRILDQDPALDAAYSASTAWADWDNDGDLDLLVTCGWGATSGQRQVNRYYRNDDGTLHRSFESTATADSGWSYGASWGDYDSDGDQDLAIANWFGLGQANFLYRNEAQAAGRRWLRVRCRGTVSNRSGIGARITLRTTIDGSPVTQIREVAGADGYCGQNLEAHFGLGDATVADTIVVQWPSGIVQQLVAVPSNQLLTIVEASTSGVPGTGNGAPPVAAPFLGTPGPSPFRDHVGFSCTLPEPAFVHVVVVDTRGRLVRELVERWLMAGPHELRWDGLADSGQRAPSGVYHVRLSVDGRSTESRKVVLVR